MIITKKEDLISFKQYGWHKGFYHDDNITESLSEIRYKDFYDYPDDDDFPYDSAFSLLFGSCNHFALSLKKVLKYTPYIIEDYNKSFHAFCQIYKTGTWYYIDARGITSSFDEFMSVAKNFVLSEYTIRIVTSKDIEEWEKNSNYNKEAYAFSEAVINKYKYYYTL